MANSGTFEGLVLKLQTNLATLKMEKKKQILRGFNKTKFKILLDQIKDAEKNDWQAVKPLVKQLQDQIKIEQSKLEESPEIKSFIESAKEYNILKDILKGVAKKEIMYKFLTTENKELLKYVLNEGKKLIFKNEKEFKSTYSALRPILMLIEEKLNKENR